jgi:hypothetical protein
MKMVAAVCYKLQKLKGGRISNKLLRYILLMMLGGGGACIFGIKPQVIQNNVDGGCGHFTMTIRPKLWLWGKNATTLSGIAGEI